MTSFLFGFVLDFIQNICRFNSLQVFSRYSSRLYLLDIISITIPDFTSDFLLVFYFFIFSKHCFNSSSFHSVFLISFYLFSFYTRLITIWNLLHIVENNGFDMISRFYISDSKFRLVIFFYFLDSFFLASISTCFSIVDSTFDSSTFYLFCLL